MPARQFFATLRAGRTIEWKKQARVLCDLAAIAFCGQATAESVEKLQASFKLRFEDPKIAKILDNEQAGAILSSVLGGRN